MPPIIGGKTLPYDSGQSGTARPEPVDVTIAPAKIRKSVENATSLAKRRGQSEVASLEPRGRGMLFISLSGERRRSGGHPLLEGLRSVDEELSAHAVVAEAAELRAGDLPAIAVVVGPDRGEVNGDVHAGDGVLFAAHDRELEGVDDVLRADVDDGVAVDRKVELVERDDVVLGVG